MTDSGHEEATAARPRLVHVLGKLDYGGLQLGVLSLIRSMAAFRHLVIAHETRPGSLSAAFESACELVRCPYPERGTPLFFVRLAAALRRLRPAAVLAHLFGNHTLVAWAARLAGVPVVVGVAASDPVRYNRSRWKPFLLAQAARPFCRGEIAVSAHVGEILRRQLGLPSARVTVIPNGRPVAAIRERVTAARRPDSPPREAMRLLVAARLGGARDHATVLAALTQLRGTGRPVELWIAGDGRRRGELERTATALEVAGAVRFLGGRDDVPELMAMCDLLVHPAESDALSMVLIEAMAAGLPIVATDVAGSREALDGGACGLLYRPGDATALAAAIARLADDEELRGSLVAAAANRVETCYDLERMAEGYSRLLRSYLDEHRRH